MMNRTIIFVHIPKTGGTTFWHDFIKKSNGKDIYYIRNNKESPLKKSLAKFKNLSDAEYNDLRWVSGHFGFGVHRYMKKSSVDYITLVREPVDRIISNYYYVLRTPEHWWFNQGFFPEMTLYELMESRLFHPLYNLQTRILCSTTGEIVSFKDKEKMDEGDLNMAKQHIDKYFSVVGMTDMFDDFLLMCKNLGYLNDISYQKKNVTIDRPKMGDVDHETLKLIKENNALYIELYNFVKKRFLKKFEETKLHKAH